MSVAANCDHEKNLSEARHRLEQVLFSLSFSRELWTEPIGSHKSGLYLNQLAAGLTNMSVDELCLWIKETEIQMGRSQEDREQGIVRIDLDLLQYDKQQYHLRDWERDYVCRLLPDIK